jgi:hypothetical protein
MGNKSMKLTMFFFAFSVLAVSSAAGLITSEAYALLRFNTEYVLKKLSEE